MAALQEILKQIEDNQKPLVEQVIRHLERQHRVSTVDVLVRLDGKALESALKAVAVRNPFLELDERNRVALAKGILDAARRIVDEERRREENRRKRPAVALDDIVKTVKVSSEVKDAWIAAGVKSTADLLTPAGAKVLVDKNVPLSKRRELLAVSKLAMASRNLKLSGVLYKEGVSSFARLARMPKKRLDDILNKSKLDENSRRDALELYREARWVHRQTQALAVSHGSARHNFGPASAHHSPDKNLKAFHNLLEIQQDPMEVGSSCATCTECESAFSPLGYLFDLLDFIDDQWQVTVDLLERILLQKIKDLDCEQSEAPTAQIRIAIRVLEKLVGGQILRNDSDWQARYRATGDALVQLMSQRLKLDPPLTTVAEMAGDQRFAGNSQAQALVTVLSSTSPALAELDASEQALRAMIVADIEARYPLSQEPPSPSDDQMITYLLERTRQEQSRDIERQEFDNQLAPIMESTWVDYRNLLIQKTQKTVKDLENLLFIHLTAAPCHRTTLITQLILSLQAFVLSVRTGEITQLKQTPRLAPIIGNTDFSPFDEETWSWLETYAKWSSAMYAFLYPENLMELPSLRDPMSPSFRETMNSLGISGTFRDIDKGLTQFGEDLQRIGSLRPLSAHVVNQELFVFSVEGSPKALWMNRVDLQSGRSKGWQLVIENKDEHIPIGVVPFYGDEETRFMAAFLVRGEYPNFKAIKCHWVSREGDSEGAPDVPRPAGVSGIVEADWSSPGSSEPLYSRLELVSELGAKPRIRWVGTIDEGAGEFRARLKSDGNWVEESPPGGTTLADFAPIDLPPHSILVESTQFTIRIGNDYSNIRIGRANETWDLNTTLGSLREVVLATNPDSMQTYVVALSWSSIIAFSMIDLEATTLGNDWCALSASPFEMRGAMEALVSDGSLMPMPLELRHLYFEEKYLHLPLLAACALNRAGDYANAHDWLIRLYSPFKSDSAEIFPFSRYFRGELDRPQAWLGDALNPYNIGRQRSGVYLRHVILAIVKNLIDWADHEFTLNNPESLNRAGDLYRLAEQILQSPELGNPCQEGLLALDFEIRRRYGLSANDVFPGLPKLSGASDARQTIEELLGLVRSGKKLKTIRRSGQKKLDSALKLSNTTKFTAQFDMRQKLVESMEHNLLSGLLSRFDQDVAERSPFIGDWVGSLTNNQSAFGIVLSISQGDDERLQGAFMDEPVEQLSIDPSRNTISFKQQQNGVAFTGKRQGGQITGVFTLSSSSRKVEVVLKRVKRGADLPDLLDLEIDPITVTLCIPPNPLLAAFSSHVTIGLLALDKCRTISGELQPATRVPPGALQDTAPTNLNLVAAGMADPLAIASDQPRYRYGYLLEQTRQRAGLAKQLGDALLGALKERDQASYDLLLAQNGRELAGASKELKDLVRTEARDAKSVANVQLDRAEDNQTFWNDRIANNPDGMSDLEREALGLLAASGWLQFSGAMVNFATALPAAIAAFAGAGISAGSISGTAASAGIALPAGVVGLATGSVIWSAALAAGGQQIAGGLQGLGGALGTWANERLTKAGFERRWEEWNLQNTLANYDAQIADLQVTLAIDRVDISDKDYEIAGLQYTHAQRVYEFLQNKTLNKELYEWMVSVLIEQFRAVMQSAAAVAQLAQRAIEFEWQAPISIVKGDYWTVDAPSLREDQKNYGLLGAERLLTDLNRLDDFRLSADKRRLQLSKTISLAQRFPSDFVRLQQTGRIEFDTLMDWFDEDFPGHYLRLIKSVRVSVLALVPPIDGIHAALTNTGASTVVFPDRPPQRSLRTFGESIALDSPYNESGLFVMDYNDPMLLPFEGLGVETHWIFEMPRASNRFDFDTIADVLFTIEYTALQDLAYAERVRLRLGTSRSANNVLSLRAGFPDQWYHLQNPLDAAQPQVVTLNIPRTFFSPNLQNLVLRHLTVILVPKDATGVSALRNRLPQDSIKVTVGGIDVNVDGNVVDQNGTMTTMRPGQPGPGNPPFTDPAFDGQNIVPFGTWEVRFASDLYTVDANNVRTLDLLADILLVPTVGGNIT